MSDDPDSDRTTSAPVTNPSAPLVGTYWLIVLIPLVWGVFQTVQKSIPLFHVTSAAAPAPTVMPVAVPAADATATPVVAGTPTAESASPAPQASVPNP